MTQPAEFLQYPHRRRGMDQDRYDWSILFRRPPIRWPDGARVALWVVVPIQWFPLDMAATVPFMPAGGVDEPYPDLRNYTHRDYGSRVGIFRVMKVLDRLGIRATAPVNAAVCERYPRVIEEVRRRRWELAAHGLHMARIHHAGLGRDDEAATVAQAVATLRRATGEPVRGWLSPGNSESLHTLDLVAAEGIEYVCDWANDELPYPMRTASGTLYSMPYGYEMSDTTLFGQFHYTAPEFAEQVQDQFDLLYREAATQGGRILSLTVHPWLIGQPHRIAALERALAHVVAHAGVWPATGAEILAAFRAQASTPA
ncbi:MAG: polysaccharide deacetylase [Candidatus Rokuibacteriota bacterium]|nr:MAG: polysaccharide deacetylase [Candidatus Rokubacteria bacterium]